MKTLIVIPARYASTRYPGKPLVKLRGADGRDLPLIQRTWETAQTVATSARVVVATDDKRIADCARSFGAEVQMTSETCANGTERCAEAYRLLGGDYDAIVNLQGDAPLTPPWFIDDLIAPLCDASDIAMATPVLRCRGDMLADLRADRQAGRVGATTAVMDINGRALYFSKEVMPFLPGDYAPEAGTPVFHHVGVYAYRPVDLLSYPTWPAGPLETQEGLEQLRFLEQGRRIRCVEVDARGQPFWELNNPEDVPKIEAMLAGPGAA